MALTMVALVWLVAGLYDFVWEDVSRNAWLASESLAGQWQYSRQLTRRLLSDHRGLLGWPLLSLLVVYVAGVIDAARVPGGLEE